MMEKIILLLIAAHIFLADTGHNPSRQPYKRRPSQKRASFKIVVDPGHGGHDPGAVRGGVLEKDVTLSVARHLLHAIKKEMPDAEVLFTRKGDEYLRLERRSEFANKAKAHVFVSIHANTSPSKKSAGVEVYYLSAKASDDEARIVAAIENAVVKLESEYEEEITQFILADMAQQEFIDQSVELAGFVQEQINKAFAYNEPKRIKSALFYVLKGVMMPAILVEIGYLSNPTEQERIQNPEYQKLVASCIAKGIKKYRKVQNRMGR